MWSFLKRLARVAICLLWAVLGYFITLLLIHLIEEIQAMAPPTSCSWLCDFVAATSGITCMECEMFGYRAAWLWAVLFALIVIGIAISVVRCLWNATVGATEENDDEPSVEIQGERYLVLVNESAGLGSPTRTLRATGTPGGGSYQWTISRGGDKIQVLTPLGQQQLIIKAASPSQVGGDISIQVSYTSDSGVASATAELTSHKPHSAVRISEQRHDFVGPDLFGYELMVRYRILDQLGGQFPEQIVNLTETLDVISPNPYGTVFQSHNYITDENAEYVDQYELTFTGQPVPADYLVRVRQRVYAEGFMILDHVVVYGPNGIAYE